MSCEMCGKPGVWQVEVDKDKQYRFVFYENGSVEVRQKRPAQFADRGVPPWSPPRLVNNSFGTNTEGYGFPRDRYTFQHKSESLFQIEESNFQKNTNVPNAGEFLVVSEVAANIRLRALTRDEYGHWKWYKATKVAGPDVPLK
jgi:hypothetical protein